MRTGRRAWHLSTWHLTIWRSGADTCQSDNSTRRCRVDGRILRPTRKRRGRASFGVAHSPGPEDPLLIIDTCGAPLESLSVSTHVSPLIVDHWANEP
jgi:hypothetical protein